MSSTDNHRVLLIDDNPAIHEDFKKILVGESAETAQLSDARSAFLSAGAAAPSTPSTAETGAAAFEIDSAMQGQEGHEMLCAACDEGRPYAMAFVDMRMPPGWDGVQTIAKLWERDPNLQVVICTAFSDYSWDETVEALGKTDRLLILKKPFDAIEIVQLASALTEKWNIAARERVLTDDLKRAKQEALAYAASLETVNQALVTSKAAAEMAAEMKTEFLVRVSNEVSTRLGEVLEAILGYENGQVEGLTPPAELELVLDICRSLLVTTGEVLDVTMLESGRRHMEAEEQSVQTLLDDLMEEFRWAAEEKALALEVTVDPSVPSVVNIEAKRVMQVLHTLVRNAIIYTEQGRVHIAVSTEDRPSWGIPGIVFEISDTGPGISAERLRTIFDPLSIDVSHCDETGSGFSLGLAKRLMALLGGDLMASSEPGRGSVFTLALPAGLSACAPR